MFRCFPLVAVLAAAAPWPATAQSFFALNPEVHPYGLPHRSTPPNLTATQRQDLRIASQRCGNGDQAACAWIRRTFERTQQTDK